MRSQPVHAQKGTPVGEADFVELLEERGERTRVEVEEAARDSGHSALLGRQAAHDAQQVLHRHVAERDCLMIVTQLLSAAYFGHLHKDICKFTCHCLLGEELTVT